MLSSCKLVGGRCPDRRLVNPEGGGIRRAQRPKMQDWPPQQNLKKVPQTELQGDPWIDLTPILCPFEERIQTHLPASSSLAGIFASCFFSFFFLVRLLFIYHLLRCLRAVPRGLYILPLILYAYRHHGLHDRGRDLLEPFEEI